MKTRLTIVLLGLLVSLAAFCQAASYTVTDLGTLSGGTSSFGYGINASGQVTGYSSTAGTTVQRAFLYDSSMHDLGALGGTESEGYGINANGAVTGFAEPMGNSADHAFVYDGAMHDLGTLGGKNSVGYGINASGQVTGDADTTGNAAYHAYLYNGSMHDLGTLGGQESLGTSINASGQVTGYSQTAAGPFDAFLYDSVHGMVDMNSLINPSSGWVVDAGQGINDVGQITGYGFIGGRTHAFLYNGGTMHDVGTVGGSSSIGYGINASGHVTGVSSTTAGANHAFLYDIVHGMVDLNSLIDPSSNWVLEAGEGINDVGQITGYGDLGGRTHAFLLTPNVPEPSSLVLAALGFLALVAWRLRRR